MLVMDSPEQPFLAALHTKPIIKLLPKKVLLTSNFKVVFPTLQVLRQLLPLRGGSGIIVEQSTTGGSSNRIVKGSENSGECRSAKINIRWKSSNSGGTITVDCSVKDAYGVDLDPSVAGLNCH
jgi:hypothetical protein